MCCILSITPLHYSAVIFLCLLLCYPLWYTTEFLRTYSHYHCFATLIFVHGAHELILLKLFLVVLLLLLKLL
jgi:hypothetical protein